MRSLHLCEVKMERNEMFVLLFCLLVQFLGIHAKNLTRSDLLRHLTNQTSYDSNYPPGYDDGNPIVVIVQLDIFDLTSISDQEMQYSLMMLMWMQWQDERLAFKDLANFSQLYLTGESVELVWTPDLYIRNERKSDSHSFIKSEKLIYIKREGTVTFSERFSMTNVCHMDLMHYPFDEQKCIITILSYAITSDDMILQWPEDSVLAGNFDLPNYDIYVDSCTEGILSDESRSLAGGTFSYLNLTLKIQRKSEAYGSMYFGPFPLFFIIAMASFGFRDQMTSRIAVCTSGMSSSVLQWIAIYARLPPVWYLTYLDVWIIIHIVIIGLILVYHSIWYMISHQARKDQDQFEDLIREVENMRIDPNDYTSPEINTLNRNLLTDLRSFPDHAKQKLINDQRYLLICDKDRDKYYKGYMKCKGICICMKAVRKNYVDFCAFLIVLGIYTWIICLFVFWAKIPLPLIVISVGLCLLVIAVCIWCGTCRRCQQTNENTNGQGNAQSSTESSNATNSENAHKSENKQMSPNSTV